MTSSHVTCRLIYVNILNGAKHDLHCTPNRYRVAAVSKAHDRIKHYHVHLIFSFLYFNPLFRYHVHVFVLLRCILILYFSIIPTNDKTRDESFRTRASGHTIPYCSVQKAVQFCLPAIHRMHSVASMAWLPDSLQSFRDKYTRKTKASTQTMNTYNETSATCWTTCK